jgi:adenylosuccinate lyase
MREGRSNGVLDALAGDARIPFDRAALDALIGSPLDFTGDARSQVARVISRVEDVTKKHPTAATYKPGSIR